MKNKKNKIKIDPGSLYYRLCPWCKEEFLATHQAQKFCSQLCRDSFHNQIKMEKIKELKVIAGIDNSDSNEKQIEVRKKTGIALNIALLNQLNIRNGLRISKADLLAKDYQFEFFDDILPFRGSESFRFFQIGHYNLFWIEYDEFFLTTKNKNSYGL